MELAAPVLPLPPLVDRVVVPPPPKVPNPPPPPPPVDRWAYACVPNRQRPSIRPIQCVMGLDEFMGFVVWLVSVRHGNWVQNHLPAGVLPKAVFCVAVV